MSEYVGKEGMDTHGDILRDEQKKKNGAKNEITYLYRDALSRLSITPAKWEAAAEQYFKMALGDNRKRIQQEKINLARSLAKDNITWQRFSQGMMLLGFDDYEITIKMRNREDGTNEVLAEHQFSVVIPNLNKRRFKRIQRNRSRLAVPLVALPDTSDEESGNEE